MVTQQVKLLKIGGSVLTHKAEHQPSLNLENLQSIIGDIVRWRQATAQRLILVMGAGSFGHPLARKYAINAPQTGKSGLGFAEITTSMLHMAQLVAARFHAAGLALCPIMTSAIFQTDQGRIVDGHLAPLSNALNAGLLPLLWGDVVHDRAHQFRILSGDQINTYLAEQLGVEDLLYGTDVDGVYSQDPHQHPDAERVAEINDQNYAALQRALAPSTHVDVTGGMQGKIREFYLTDHRPLRGVIYNATRPSYTYQALCGLNIGTRLFFEQKLPSGRAEGG